MRKLAGRFGTGQITTFDPDIIAACDLSDIAKLRELLQNGRITTDPVPCRESELHTMSTPSESSFTTDSTDCGYCSGCNPEDPLLTSIRMNRADVVETLLTSTSLPVQTPSECLRAAAALPDDRILQRLIDDPRFLPKSSVTDYIRAICLADHWKITSLPAMLDLPVNLVKQSISMGIVNDREWLRRWEYMKVILGRGGTLDEGLATSFTRPVQIVGVVVDPFCCGWARDPGICYHIFIVYSSDGSVSTRKDRGSWILKGFEGYIMDDAVMKHLKPAAGRTILQS